MLSHIATTPTTKDSMQLVMKKPFLLRSEPSIDAGAHEVHFGFKSNGLLRTETSMDGCLDLEAFLPKKNTLMKDSSIGSEIDFESHWLPNGSVEPEFQLHSQTAPNNHSHADIMAAIHQLQAEEAAAQHHAKQEEGRRVVAAQPPKQEEESQPESEEEEVGQKRKRLDPKEKKEVQGIAREGQKHWGEKVKAMRQEWVDRSMWEKDEQFTEQFRMCKRQKIKNQNECLLHQLQFSLVDGLVYNVEYGHEDETFVGWKTFWVNSHPSNSSRFRQRIRDMFGSTPSEKTLNNTLRRAGIVPQGASGAPSPTGVAPQPIRKNHDWKSAWAGIIPFVYDHEQREKGKGSTSTAAAAE